MRRDIQSLLFCLAQQDNVVITLEDLKSVLSIKSAQTEVEIEPTKDYSSFVHLRFFSQQHSYHHALVCNLAEIEQFMVYAYEQACLTTHTNRQFLQHHPKELLLEKQALVLEYLSHPIQQQDIGEDDDYFDDEDSQSKVLNSIIDNTEYSISISRYELSKISLFGRMVLSCKFKFEEKNQYQYFDTCIAYRELHRYPFFEVKQMKLRNSHQMFEHLIADYGKKIPAFSHFDLQTTMTQADAQSKKKNKI